MVQRKFHGYVFGNKGHLIFYVTREETRHVGEQEQYLPQVEKADVRGGHSTFPDMYGKTLLPWINSFIHNSVE
jgi:hypothetical protein